MTRYLIAVTLSALCASSAFAQAPAESPEVLVARAASLFGSLEFGPAEEEEALRSLTDALSQDPANPVARKLLELIQKRREEREEQQRQQGQQQLEQEQRQGQQQPEQQEAGGPEDREQDEQDERPSPSQDEEVRPPEDGQAPTGGEPEEGMTQEEAERLLDALEEQEQKPEREVQRGRSTGPRW